VHLALGLLLRLFATEALRAASRMAPQTSCNFLLALRFVPTVFALFAATWTIPTYLLLERVPRAETVGFFCLGSAVLGILCIAVPLVRGLISVSRTLHYLRLCRRAGRAVRLPGERKPALVIEGERSFFALVGVFSPRLVISAPVVGALSANELAAALRHERAHYFAKDNLKRLLILLAPEWIPFFGGFATIEKGWARASERAADNRAAAGDSRRSLSLAAALVRMAQLGVCRVAPAAVMPLLSHEQDLAERVNRLLGQTEPRLRPSRPRKRWAAAALALCVCTSALAAQPAALRTWGHVLERLHNAGIAHKHTRRQRWHPSNSVPNSLMRPTHGVQAPAGPKSAG
jgi:Zn-dependent protease with chaperone function